MEQTEYTDFDIGMMEQAILASGNSCRKDLKLFGGPFGALIVKDGKIVGYGFNCVLDQNDPTAHAEVQAIRNAGHNLKNFDLSGSILYTSCEPCPMCLMAAKWANIDKIYYAATRKDAAKLGFKDEELYKMLKRGKFAIQIKECRKAAVKEMKKWKKKYGEEVNY